jgi:hypothetical protein
MPMPLPPSPGSPGLAYWVATLHPWAQAGYKHGIVGDDAVVLVNQATGDEVILPRPSASWVNASLVVPASDADDARYRSDSGHQDADEGW